MNDLNAQNSLNIFTSNIYHALVVNHAMIVECLTAVKLLILRYYYLWLVHTVYKLVDVVAVCSNHAPF